MDEIAKAKVEVLYKELLIIKSKLELIGMDHKISQKMDDHLWDASALLSDVINEVINALNA